MPSLTGTALHMMNGICGIDVSDVATRRRQFLWRGDPWTEVHGYHHSTAIAVQEGPDQGSHRPQRRESLRAQPHGQPVQARPHN